ncbi:uncharacterized protein LOC116410460 [Xenopus tropicalis]|uniref:Uncharacterized protein LOC116410460 n=1 Tax=Xenopus tropicalis TaxID=8364 RepID=A0A8J1JIZ8_XENTR|nr:uncharacterized protein LOC116410460 [Xenopus tropicalis]
MFIIALAVLVILSLPGAAVWFLYYRLKKKYGINDVEKATEEPQAKPSISGITTWLRLLFGKLREKKPIYDEEKAIEKSQPKPTTSKTTLRSKGKKKKKTKTKKKKAPVNKSVEEATVTPLTNQCTEEPVQSDQSPQAPDQITHSMPKENVGVTNVIEQQHTVPRGELSQEHTVESAKEICSKVRYKRVIVLTWTEEIIDDEDDEVSTHQTKECQKEISVALKPDMRQASEPQKEQPSTTSTTKPKTIPDGLK